MRKPFELKVDGVELVPTSVKMDGVEPVPTSVKMDGVEPVPTFRSMFMGSLLVHLRTHWDREPVLLVLVHLIRFRGRRTRTSTMRTQALHGSARGERRCHIELKTAGFGHGPSRKTRAGEEERG